MTFSTACRDVKSEANWIEDEKARNLFRAIEQEFFTEGAISPEFDPEDIKIGHSYFIGEKEVIGNWVEKYNQEYVHSALGYLSPLEFEQKFYQNYCQEAA